MTLSCGVNDVWHGAKGISLEDYKTNITNIVDKTQAAGIKVVILTSTMITENPDNPNNLKLAAARNTSVDNLLNNEFSEIVNSLLKSGTP